MADDEATQLGEHPEMQVENEGEIIGSPTELAEDSEPDVDVTGSGASGVNPRKVKIEKKRRRAARGRDDGLLPPVPDDTDDEDSPSKRALRSDDQPLSSREMRELLTGHLAEMKLAWGTFQGRLDKVEGEQSRAAFEVTNLQTRMRVAEKDVVQQKQHLSNHGTALENLTNEVKNMKVKLGEMDAKMSSSSAGGGPSDVAGRPDPWAAYLQQRAPNSGPQERKDPSHVGETDKGDLLSAEDMRTLVVGGWLQDTKRSIIEEESATVLGMAELKDLLDSEKLIIYGPRRSVGLLRFVTRPEEEFKDTKNRMWEIVKLLGRLKHALPSTRSAGEEKTLWASFVKTKNARVRSSHVSMVRRVAIALAKDHGQGDGANSLITSYDCDWNMGTLWNGSEKLGSATHRQPKGSDEIVLMSGGWVNVSAVARVAGCATDDSKRTGGATLASVCNTQMGESLYLEFGWTTNIDCDIVFCQEVARGDVGWNTEESDDFYWVTHRHDDQWRGAGIGIALDKFDSILHKVAGARGFWVVARLVGIGRIVLGSLHCHTGVTNAVYQAAVHEFCRLCPRKYRHLPLLCGADANEQTLWDENDATGKRRIGTCSSNLNALIHDLLQHGVEAIAPTTAHLHTPTHYPRDESRTGRQIDVLLSRHLYMTPLLIDPDRRHVIGSDHAIVMGDIMVASGPSSVRWGNDSRARWVVRDIPATEIVDEDDLIELARTCTRPRQTSKYRDPDGIKDAIAQARASGLPADWKSVHRMRRQARRKWSEDRLAAIVKGDWDQYRLLQNEKKRKRGWWGSLLANRRSVDLAGEIKSHLESKMTNPERPAAVWEAQLGELIRDCNDGGEFRPFVLLDVRTELQAMKCRSAVGPDGVGVHLLRVLASDDLHGPQLLSLINHIVETRQLPGSWETSFLALLAKIKLPESPADLRPICVSSAFHKLVNRLVCARALPIMDAKLLIFLAQSRVYGTSQKSGDTRFYYANLTLQIFLSVAFLDVG
ncbi:unnamed protein product [Symbiodinium sp. CCMP2592]|nr:unnamed protein product [Symbiodinium sp. CCMP2592]